MRNIVGYTSYTCVQGDTFDKVALYAYSDEFEINALLEANKDYADVLIFEGGEVLKIPVWEETKAATSLPPWRQ